MKGRDLIPLREATGRAGPTCRIGGTLLEQLKELKRGEVLTLAGTSGRIYAIMNWEDLAPHIHVVGDDGQSN